MAKFAKLLGAGDAVITFNWDLLVEEALYDLNKEWEYKLTDGAISILKPHGSLDWFDSKEVSIDQEIDISPSTKKFKRIPGIQAFSGTGEFRGRPCPSFFRQSSTRK